MVLIERDGSSMRRPASTGDRTLSSPHGPLCSRCAQPVFGGTSQVQSDETRAATPARDDVIIRDVAMSHVYGLAKRAAPSGLPVMILGETGCGKEVLAETVHRQSARFDKPFLRLNCAGFVEQLFESEFFGHCKGAFTGAVADKPGLLEVAGGGTMFLDEIGDMPLSVQGKLLRVLEDGRVFRVGSVESHAVDVRFITATHRDLPEEVEAGRFRQDLYYRLNGLTLRVPPLRERVSEIEPLARHFRRRAGATAELTEAAVHALERHTWPGNVRELRQVMERAAVLAGDEPISPSHLLLEAPPAQATAEGARAVAQQIIDTAQRDEVLDALDACRGNQTRAAQMLSVSRRTLVRRLARLGVPRPRK